MATFEEEQLRKKLEALYAGSTTFGGKQMDFATMQPKRFQELGGFVQPPPAATPLAAAPAQVTTPTPPVAPTPATAAPPQTSTDSLIEAISSHRVASPTVGGLSTATSPVGTLAAKVQAPAIAPQGSEQQLAGIAQGRTDDIRRLPQTESEIGEVNRRLGFGDVGPTASGEQPKYYIGNQEQSKLETLAKTAQRSGDVAATAAILDKVQYATNREEFQVWRQYDANKRLYGHEKAMELLAPPTSEQQAQRKAGLAQQQKQEEIDRLTGVAQQEVTQATSPLDGAQQLARLVTGQEETIDVEALQQTAPEAFAKDPGMAERLKQGQRDRADAQEIVSDLKSGNYASLKNIQDRLIAYKKRTLVGKRESEIEKVVTAETKVRVDAAEKAVAAKQKEQDAKVAEAKKNLFQRHSGTATKATGDITTLLEGKGEVVKVGDKEFTKYEVGKEPKFGKPSGNIKTDNETAKKVLASTIRAMKSGALKYSEDDIRAAVQYGMRGSEYWSARAMESLGYVVAGPTDDASLGATGETGVPETQPTPQTTPAVTPEPAAVQTQVSPTVDPGAFQVNGSPGGDQITPATPLTSQQQPQASPLSHLEPFVDPKNREPFEKYLDFKLRGSTGSKAEKAAFATIVSGLRGAKTVQEMEEVLSNINRSKISDADFEELTKLLIPEAI